MKFFASLAILSLFATVRAQTIAPANNDAIQRELTTIATALKVPALGGAIVHSDGQISTFVTGVRESGSDVAATVTDQWHLGSCTKAMTAMLVALLVERGDLTWDRPLAFLLPNLGAPMDADYARLTLVELLAHRAGLPSMTGPDEDLRGAQLCPC